MKLMPFLFPNIGNNNWLYSKLEQLDTNPNVTTQAGFTHSPMATAKEVVFILNNTNVTKVTDKNAKDQSFPSNQPKIEANKTFFSYVSSSMRSILPGSVKNVTEASANNNLTSSILSEQERASTLGVKEFTFQAPTGLLAKLRTLFSGKGYYALGEFEKHLSQDYKFTTKEINAVLTPTLKQGILKEGIQSRHFLDALKSANDLKAMQETNQGILQETEQRIDSLTSKLSDLTTSNNAPTPEDIEHSKETSNPQLNLIQEKSRSIQESFNTFLTGLKSNKNWPPILNTDDKNSPQALKEKAAFYAEESKSINAKLSDLETEYNACKKFHDVSSFLNSSSLGGPSIIQRAFDFVDQLKPFTNLKDINQEPLSVIQDTKNAIANVDIQIVNLKKQNNDLQETIASKTRTNVSITDNDKETLTHIINKLSEANNEKDALNQELKKNESLVSQSNKKAQVSLGELNRTVVEPYVEGLSKSRNHSEKALYNSIKDDFSKEPERIYSLDDTKLKQYVEDNNKRETILSLLEAAILDHIIDSMKNKHSGLQDKQKDTLNNSFVRLENKIKEMQQEIISNDPEKKSLEDCIKKIESGEVFFLHDSEVDI